MPHKHKPKGTKPEERILATVPAEAPQVPQDATEAPEQATAPTAEEAAQAMVQAVPSVEDIQALAQEVRRLGTQQQITAADRLAILESHMVQAAVMEHLYTAALHNEIAALCAKVDAMLGVADEPMVTVNLEDEATRFERVYLYGRLALELNYLRQRAQVRRLIVPTAIPAVMPTA